MKKTYIILAITSLILLITGFYTYDLFLQFMLPKDDNLKIVYTSLNEQFKNCIYHSVLLGLMPFALYLTWRLGKITSRKNRIISILIVLVAVILALLIDMYGIHLVAGFRISDKITNTMSVSGLRLTQFIFGGLLLGMLISWLLFRKRRDKI